MSSVIRRRLIAAILLITATSASAQRATDNAVTAAEDAFGVSIGRESIGLYSSADVRGFSPVDAGNVRLDGLYFDPIRLPPSLLLESTAIRVGIASQGFAFPAPTGVVDIAFGPSPTNTASSAYIGLDSNGFATAEYAIDGVIVPGVLTGGLGVGAYRAAYGNGTTERNGVLTQRLQWTPHAALGLQSFMSFSRATDSEPPPVYLSLDGDVPPPLRLRQFNGPDWAQQRRDRINYGVLATITPAPGWRLRTGLFRSESREQVSFDNLYLNVTPDGQARQLVLADPAGQQASTSGELRLDREVVVGDTLHRLIASVRGRQRTRVFGGTDAIDLGPVGINQRQRAGRPDFTFGPTDADEIDQTGFGLAYEVRRTGLGEITLSALASDYRKQSTPAGEPAARATADPVLYAGAAAVHLSEHLSLYASYSDGLEDSGAAPSSAANRNAPLPASATRQRDAGLRWQLRPGLRLVAGVFSLQKPYFEFDRANVYRQLGVVANRGVELSLSGALSPQLDLVLGAVASDPTLRSADAGNADLGQDPVDQPRLRVGLNVDWRPDWLRGASLDAGLSHLGRRAATADNRVDLPARTVIDLGARLPLRLADHPAQLRLAITNIGDTRGWDSSGSGAYVPMFGRAAELSLAVDF